MPRQREPKLCVDIKVSFAYSFLFFWPTQWLSLTPSSFSPCTAKSLSDAYQSPWKTPEQTDMNEACQLIKEVVLGLSPDASLEAFSAVSEEDPERGKYLQFQVPGRFGLDKVSEVETNQTTPLPLPSFLLLLLLLLPLCCCCYRTGMLTVCIRRWSSW